jgi:ComF family protein
MKDIVNGLMAAVDLLLPRTCIVCGGRLLRNETHICLKCTADMPLTHFWNMSRNPMADRFNELIQENMGEERENYAYAAALFFYHSEAGYRQIPYQIKYHGNTDAGRHFGISLGRKLISNTLWSDVDMVIPVPLHWTRRWKRGYNQAEVIADGAAEAMGKPMRTDVLVRHRRTRTQTKVDVGMKGRNVSGAFSVKEEAAMIFRNGGNVRHILLVDDVFTTGSTLHACFSALREVFPPAVRISVATLGLVER